ncbi:hypothetical protein ALP99_01440 [Pseudomonas syringae pv. tomato]|uniref:Uncharacterized protein n=1 Tax=Pseudomonas syringae pv. tomato TaxID=323 RepID=A0AAQ0NF00_PSEUB|nr:hypothetical protein PSTA9_05595 [Pseudomonas syringae pv. tomato]KUR47748.1 hypothetical protein PST407_02471 [Pseudomonas syringae pv. tomato]RMQ66536.1 hypothetical protein ALQ00_01375 [Pseudomonas syringae pv. tomato]RMQ76099.1 hypothetical protein ALP99_01440 [Pseudomonas syringae pv. tomato]CAI8864821.1 hypothetical protein DAPPPG215_14005 [Pseudomonas syringae pv. tomato]
MFERLRDDDCYCLVVVVHLRAGKCAINVKFTPVQLTCILMGDDCDNAAGVARFARID